MRAHPSAISNGRPQIQIWQQIKSIRTPARVPVLVRSASLALEGQQSSSGPHGALPESHQRNAYQKELFQKMLRFAGPALLIPLADPLMGLVDSVTIGQFAGTIELAALGPANMVFGFAIYVFQSLQVATLSLMASDLRDGRREHAALTLGTALRIALVAGIASTVLLAAMSTPIITATGVRDATLAGLAAGYLKIRALAQPAVLLTMVAQSGMLAQQDSLTPCLSVMLTVTASLIANIVFVAWLGWGLQGAAITTVATQYLGSSALLWALHRKQSKLKPDWRPPASQDLWTFLSTMVPLTVMSMSKNTCYLIVQTTAAALSFIHLAAHQAAFSLWALCTWSISPIEQACLAYLPTAETLWQRQAAAQLVVSMGVVLALAVAVVMLGMLWAAPGLLTKDVAVQPLVAAIAPQASLSMALVGVDVCATAVNLACRDFTFIARSYVVTLAGMAGYFVACRHYGWGLGGVWWGLFLFFAIRGVQSLGRAVWLLRGPQPEQEDTGQQQQPGGQLEATQGAEGLQQTAASIECSSEAAEAEAETVLQQTGEALRTVNQVEGDATGEGLGSTTHHHNGAGRHHAGNGTSANLVYQQQQTIKQHQE